LVAANGVGSAANGLDDDDAATDYAESDVMLGNGGGGGVSSANPNGISASSNGSSASGSAGT